MHHHPDRTQNKLIEGSAKRIEESLQTLQAVMNTLEPSSLVRTGYELGVADAISKLHITEEDILKVLNTAMNNVN